MMKNGFLVLLVFLLISCEDVVDIELEQTPPRLVVEASLLWSREKEVNMQFIRLTTTAPYFDESTPPALEAKVSVFTEEGREYFFEEVEPGLFRSLELMPEFGETYELQIEYDGEVYRATEQLVSTPQLEYVTQKSDAGFSGDETEFKLFYTDPEDIRNFYFFRFFHEEMGLQIYDDEFTNGSQTFAFFSEEDVEPGEVVGFEIQGISEDFYRYLFLLRSQAGSSNGGPFQTQPTTVRGNIINISNPENFAFGYFRLSETDFLSYEVE